MKRTLEHVLESCIYTMRVIFSLLDPKLLLSNYFDQLNLVVKIIIFRIGRSTDTPLLDFKKIMHFYFLYYFGISLVL